MALDLTILTLPCAFLSRFLYSQTTNVNKMISLLSWGYLHELRNGEFVDFVTLLSSAIFLGSIWSETSSGQKHLKSLTIQLTPMVINLLVCPNHSPERSSFVSWMEVWNIYLVILMDLSPVSASQLVAYQRIITLASIQYPLAAWLNYDVQFRTLPYTGIPVKRPCRYIHHCLTPVLYRQKH